MKVLITGAAGFLGSHLIDRFLAEGHEVLGMDNFVTGSPDNIAHLAGHPKFRFVRHDVTEFMYVEGPLDGVLHFASPASPVDYLELPIQTLKVGSLGTHKALGLAKAKGARFFLASTSEVYGDPQVHPQPESYWGHVNPIGSRSCYDEGKRCAETLFFDYRRQHGMPIKVARIFNTFGPAMRPDDGRVVSTFIVQALRQQPLTVFGDGTQTRSFCYVDDMVEALIRLMDTPSGVTGPINLGNPHEFTMLELAHKVIELVGDGTIEHRPRPADDPIQRRPDIAQAQELLDWKPTIDLDEGLVRTVDYFRELLDDTRGRSD